MHFRSIHDLYLTVWRNLHVIPCDIDLVVGIPRSGMLVASMIALARNLPLADIDGLVEGRLLSTGHTRAQATADARSLRHALIVDDSSRTGDSMAEALEKLRPLSPPMRFTSCVAYGPMQPIDGLDIVMEQVPEPRVFEWNVMHHPIIERSCLDIDGVLCLDPREEEQDGPLYESFLARATPLHTPKFRIGTLVTSRLEKYRAQTEDWLASNGIAYGELAMLDLPDAATRRKLQAHAPFKAEVYQGKDSPLFIESESRQAREIATMSGKPVLSLEGPQMFRPGLANLAAVKRNLRSGNLLKEMAKAALGPSRIMRLKQRLRA